MSRRAPLHLALAGVCLLGLALRAAGFASVFPGGGEVVLSVGDGLYHARLARYTLEHFPRLLTFDPYLGFPDGARVPAPPLPDLLAVAVTRASGGGPATLEHVLAWMAPVLGALSAVAVYAGARVLAGPWAAVGAAALFSLLPIAVGASRVGDADHHALVNGLGAVLLALLLRTLRPGARLGVLAAALALTRLALALSWSGSLLYLGLAEASLLLAGAASRRRELLLCEAWSAGATALLLAPAVLLLGPTVGGPYSAVNLSWLHVCALAASAGVAALLAWAEARRPAPSAQASLLRLAGAGGLAAAAGVALTGLPEGLAPGLHFVASAESGAYVVAELMPLFSLPGRPALQSPALYFGAFAYLLPLAPVAALLSARRPALRAPATLLAGWTAFLAALTFWQVRFGADLAAPAAIAFALPLGAAGGALVRRSWPPAAAGLAGVLVLAALLWTPLRAMHLPSARLLARPLIDGPTTHDRVLASPSGSLKRFLESVQEVTPETAGFLDPTERPEYGVLNRMRIGHAIRYWARRPPTADGALDVVAPSHFADARAFFELGDEAEGLRIAERLRARYVITMFFPGIPEGTLGARLQHGDGAGGATADTRLEHFRHVSEGPAGGRPLSDLFGMRRPRNVVPYKLFEIVPGALLEAAAPSGEILEVALPLRTPLGRRFTYRASARAGADGAARVRVPYATDGLTPTRSLGPYRARVGGRSVRVHVPEQAVRAGASIRVDTGGPEATPAEAASPPPGDPATSAPDQGRR